MSSTFIAAGPVPRRADSVETAPRLPEDWLALVIGLLVIPSIVNHLFPVSV